MPGRILRSRIVKSRVSPWATIAAANSSSLRASFHSKVDSCVSSLDVIGSTVLYRNAAAPNRIDQVVGARNRRTDEPVHRVRPSGAVLDRASARVLEPSDPR